MYYALLDNGHGVDVLGKQAPDKSILEYLYTRELATAIYSRLLDIPNNHSDSHNDNCNIKPILITPELQDISLSERVKRINNYCNKYGAANCIMISIHLNAAGNGQWMNGRGWECYTTPGQNNSDKLATILYNKAKLILPQNNISIRTDNSDGDPDKEAHFYIIRKSNCPAVLTENLFMDNRLDNKYLLSPTGFNSIVAIHTAAIKEWFGES